MKKKVIYLFSLITLIFSIKGLNVSASTEAKEVARSPYSNRNVNEVAEYLNSLDETYSRLFKVRITDYRYVVEYSTGSHSIVYNDDVMLYPVSNKKQVTTTHQTSIELDRTADYMFPNTIGFYGISNSVFLPYHYLASDQISGSSYDADTEKTDYKNNKWGDNPQTVYKIQVDRKVDCVFLNNNANSINPKIYTTDATNRVGQYAQLYVYGNYVSKTIRIRKEKRKVSGNYEVLSREDCTIYVFVIKGYMVNWTFE